MDKRTTEREEESVVEYDVLIVDAEQVLTLLLLDVALVVLAALAARAE